MQYPTYNVSRLENLPVLATDKCIVLDIDHTCLATMNDAQSISTCKQLTTNHTLGWYTEMMYNGVIYDASDSVPLGQPYTICGVLRPGVREFINFACNYFKVVAIWSAGRKKYVDMVVELIFKDAPRPPDVIFSYQECTDPYENIMGKPLSKMIGSHPLLTKHMSLKNTIIIDDYPQSFANNPHNGILIPGYHPEVSVDGVRKPDDAWHRITQWFDSPAVRSSTDVTLLDKQHIFSS